MSNINLVTGYAGKPHVSSLDHGALNTMIFGSDSFVLPFGSQFAATVVQQDDVQARIQIADGDMMVQGRHIRIAKGMTDSVSISMPEQDRYGAALIVVHYEQDNNGIETCSLRALQSTESTKEVGFLQPTEGDLTDANCQVHEFMLYKVKMYGSTITLLEPAFTVKNPLYNVNSVAIQSGTAEIEYSPTRVTETEVKFPFAFSKKPVVIVSQVFNSQNIVVRPENVTKSGFIAELDAVGTSGEREFSWIAMA